MIQDQSNFKPRKWYNKHIFPLVPTLDIRKSNENITGGFSFKWLFFTLWSIDSFSFQLAIVADTHWGVGIIGLFPYFRWAITIPCPQKLDTWIHNNLSRDRKFNRLNK